MPDLPLPDLLRELAAALEDPSHDEGRSELDAIRFALEVRAGSRPAVEELGAAVQRLQSERDRAVEMLETALADKHALEAKLATSERSRKWALSARRRLRARLAGLQPSKDPGAGASAPEPPVADAKQIEEERIARAAAEASLAYAESDRRRLQAALEGAMSSREAAAAELEEARRLIEDLQAELGELWRVMRETRPGEPLLINVKASEGDRREGIERVQAKIIDARELFKRRSGRWPVAI
jgi:hypothetical protein